MNKKFRGRIVSILLVLILAVQMLPLETFAQSVSEQIAEEKASILYEAAGLRDAHTKVYLMDDGSYSVITSPEPLHYFKDGKWQEIDNSLTQADNSAGEAVLTNQDNTFDVSLPADMTTDVPVCVTADDVSVSFQMNDVDKSEPIYAEVTPEPDMNNASELQQASNLDKITSEVTYPSVQEHVDLTYNIQNNSIKESIIINEKIPEGTSYSYTLSARGLTAALCRDKSILFENDCGETVFTIPAPYMFDGNAVYSDDIDVSFTQDASGQYTLVYTPDPVWMNSRDRVYPVTIDPIIRTSGTDTISDTYVTDEAGCNANTNADLSTALVGQYGTVNSAAVFGFDVNTNCRERVVTNAQLKFYASADSDIRLKAQIFDLGNTNTYSQLQNAANQTIDSVQINEGDVAQYTLDVTSLISTAVDSLLYFYDDKALVLSAYDETQTGCATIFTGENADASKKPVLEYNIVETVGRDNSFEYHDYTAGRAGDVSVNDFTRGIYIVRDDIGLDGNVMPVAISQHYSTATANITGTLYDLFTDDYEPFYDVSTPYGLRWFTNYHRFISFMDGYYIDGQGNEIDLYMYLDGDGNEKYFVKSETENGTETWVEFCNKTQKDSGFKMLVPSSVSGSTNYEGIQIIEPSKQSLLFDAKGRMVKITQAPDDNVQTPAFIQIQYESALGIKISNIIDGVGRKYTFTYDSGNFLLSIQVFDKNGQPIQSGGKNLKVTYTKRSDSDTCVSQVTFPDGKMIEYYYQLFLYPDELIISGLVNVDGYTIGVYIDTKGHVNYITESSKNGPENVKGNEVRISCEGPYQRTFTDLYGGTETKHFDRYGRVTGIYDKDGEYVQYRYEDVNISEPEDTPVYKNILTGTQYIEDENENLIVNPGFENNMTGWTAPSSNAAGSSVTADSGQALLGTRSCKITASSNGLTRALKTYTNLNEGVYTFSAFVKIPVDLVTNGLGARIYARVTSSSGSYKEFWAPYRTTTNGLWQRESVQFSVDENTSNVQVFLMTNRCEGSVYFDNIKLEQGDTASGYSILDNGAFEQTENNLPAGWTGDHLASEDTVSAGEKFGETLNVMKITGSDAAHNKSLSKTIPLCASAGDTITFGGWAKALTCASGQQDAAFRIRVAYNGGTDGRSAEAVFTPYVSYWQYAAGGLTFKEDCTSVTVYLEYSKQINEACFADIKAFFRDGSDTAEASKAAPRSANQSSAPCPCGSQCCYGSGCDCTCASYAVCNCRKCKSSFVYEYDAHGNLLSSTLNELNHYYKSENEYTEDGNYLKSHQTVLYSNKNIDNKITYNYEANNNGTNASTTDANGRTTEYTYDAMRSLAKAEREVSGLTDGQTSVYNAYAYTNDELTSLQRANGTVYNFGYDAWGNKTSVTVGNVADLASYTYGTGRDRDKVMSVTYGANQTVSYSYNTAGKVTGISYDGGESWAYLYTYSADGELVCVIDNLNAQTIEYAEKGVRVYTNAQGQTEPQLLFSSEYDADGNCVETMTGAGGYSFVYDYDADEFSWATGKTTSGFTVSGASSGVSVQNVRDFYGRKGAAITEVENAADQKISVENEAYYDFYPGSDGNWRESDRVGAYYADIKINDRYTTDSISHFYSWDQSGNMTEKRRNDYDEEELWTVYYTYDEANQLIRADDESTQQTICYAYDSGGNITEKKVYAFTREKEITGTPLDTVSYTYDSAWQDKLTSYDGKAVSYAAGSGDITAYDGMSFTWDCGRRLAGIEKAGGAESAYAYNGDGLRTKKTVTENGTEKVYTYIWDSDVLISRTCGDESLYFIYDKDDEPVGFIDKKTGAGAYEKTYLYMKDYEGDICGILDENGAVAVTYAYDVWGKLLSVGGALADTLGRENPIRYRGYQYDEETGLYYVKSRYYNPEWGRFISGDITVQSSEDILATNIFAYCENNPASLVDDGGTAAKGLNEETINLVFNPIYKAGKALYSADRGLLGFGFTNPEAENFMDWFRTPWTTTVRCIQYGFGYVDYYDTLAFLGGCFIDCLKTEFKYAGKDWRIELWKGRYGINIGCEIGIYYKRTWFAKVTSWYSCSDVNYPMLSILLLIKGANKNPQVEEVFTMVSEHWWLTGFMFNVTTPVVLGNKNKLAMIGAINFGDEIFAELYVRKLIEQNGDEAKALALGTCAAVLWGDVNNLIVGQYYGAVSFLIGLLEALI